MIPVVLRADGLQSRIGRLAPALDHVQRRVEGVRVLDRHQRYLRAAASAISYRCAGRYRLLTNQGGAEPMGNFGRKISLTLSVVFLAPVATKAVLWSFEEPRYWQTARWSSAGILPEAASDPQARIVVFAARTAGWRGILAVHTWIVVKAAGADAYTRYEVTGFGRPLRINGRPPDGYWLGDRPRIVADIRGTPAAAAIPKIEAAITAYPYTEYGDYRMWPGPNSNTFVATVLRAAPELEIAMPPEAIGKDYRIDGAWLGRTASRTGVEAGLYGLLGLKVGMVEGIELNVLSLVAGLDALHPALKIPAFGRIDLDRAAPRPAVADPQGQAR